MDRAPPVSSPRAATASSNRNPKNAAGSIVQTRCCPFSMAAPIRKAWHFALGRMLGASSQRYGSFADRWRGGCVTRQPLSAFSRNRPGRGGAVRGYERPRRDER